MASDNENGAQSVAPPPETEEKLAERSEKKMERNDKPAEKSEKPTDNKQEKPQESKPQDGAKPQEMKPEAKAATAEALPRVLDELGRQGWKFVTVSEMLREWAAFEKGPHGREGRE